MATYTAYGNTVNDFRLKMTVTTYAGYCIVSVWGQALGYGHSWSATLSRYGAWSGSNAVNMQSGWGEYKDVLFYSAQVNGAGTKSFGAQVNTPFGNSTVTVDNAVIPAAGNPPLQPTGVDVTWTSDTSVQIDFTKGSGSTETYIAWAQNEGAWYWGAGTTGTRYETGLAADSRWEFWLRAYNSHGSSAWTPTYYLYTKPAQPTKPTLGADGEVTWQNKARYRHGVQLQRSDDMGASETTVELGAVQSWTDPNPQNPFTRYRTRTWAGPSMGQARTYSDWSEWSESALAVLYTAPTLSRFEVARCDINGDPVEFGEYLRIVHSGSVASVKDLDNTELNTRTLTARWRPKGSTAGWTTHTIVNAGTPTSWSNTQTILGPGFSPVQAWDIQLVLSDEWNTVTQQTEVPVAATALSLGTNNVGIGKIVERGALDVRGDMYLEGTQHLVADGEEYALSGTITVTATVNTAWAGLYYRRVSVTMPKAPPAGWRYVLFPGGKRFCWIDIVDDGTTKTFDIDIYRPENTTSAAYTLVWQLIKAA